MNTDATLDEMLAQVASTPQLLVALDFDGTLSPLNDKPMASRMLPAARDALELLLSAPNTTVALVSGRSMHDLREIAEHTDDSLLLLAGSHGAEFWIPGAAQETGDDAVNLALRDRLRDEAVGLTAGVEGVWIEPKTFGFGVHTRLVDPAEADGVHQIVADLVAAEAPSWRGRNGHNISEYSFRDEGKDTAIAHLREVTGATAVLFAGDDVTDEDAMVALEPDDLGVRVGAGDTAARYRVADIPEMADLLARLAHLRGAQE